jgi:rRNA maturation RNase YbeY
LSLANALRILEMRRSLQQRGVRFHYLVPVRIPAGKMRALVVRLLGNHGKRPGAVNFIFCSDQYLLKINQEYLGHGSLTDIITFDLSGEPVEVVADIFISAERVRENAKRLMVPVSVEFARVMIHGALHLVGFKDKTQRDKKVMRQSENKYLKLLGKSVPRETKAKKKFHVKHGKRVS